MTERAKPDQGRGMPRSSGMGRRRALACLAAMGAACVFSPLSLVLAAEDPLVASQDLLNAGKITEAVAQLSRIIAADPRNERALILLGRAYARSDRPAEALAAFRMALRINPADTHTRMLADILAQNPLPEHPAHGHAGPGEKGGRRAVSKLEKLAEAERAAFVSGKGWGPRGERPFRLVLDAGHGGPEMGGIGASGLREKDVALELALETARRIQAQGPEVAVFLTRLSDIPLSEAARAACADLYGADLFVSLHAPRVDDAGVSGLYFFTPAAKNGRDGGDSRARDAARATAAFENRSSRGGAGFPLAGESGIEQGLVRAGVSGRLRARSQDYAALLHEKMGSGPFPGRGGIGSAAVSLLSRVTVPVVFVAVGFVSNKEDEAVLADGVRRLEVARTLAEALGEAARKGALAG
ncbi:N-acetylmuramoyl-L-alanine amidase [Desulfolutivibrio sulfoxidireducens]|uniref:N-acetylmuramoyl-L-alanine amidase n=1 Tax=Desulfolutivibrio sulfoxidireducens TaxID=2773299 RepID=UPI00159E4E30|nr:N-acetylmuramoyl-L-alanine amidase [Desulfolutivibrio sulfoxidireducens]